MIRFEWDENKNKRNIQKHKVSFEEALSAFFDDEALLIFDPDHSIEEDRYLLLGLTNNGELLVVVHSYIRNEVVRIISSRKATKNEQIQHFKRRK